MIDAEAMNKMTEDVVVSAIVAVGMSGQIGLNGKLPWLGDPDLAEIVVKDLANFKKLTTGGVVVVGRNTWPSVSHLDGTCNRDFLVDGATTYIFNEETNSNESVKWDFWVPKYIAELRHAKGIGEKEVWIAGGAKTYSKWLPHIRDLHVFEIPYDGPADRYLPKELEPENIDTRKTNVFITAWG